MTSTQALSAVAGVVNFIATILYVISIWRGHTKPSRVTWAIWTALSLLTAGGMYQSGTLNGQMYAVVVGDIVITSFALLWGSGGWTRVDRWSLAGALIGLTVWVLTKDPFYAILISLSVNYIGAVPTIAKTWKYLGEEDLVACGVVTLATFIQFLAVTEWTFAAGGVKRKVVPFLFAQKRSAERRVAGHFAEHDVGLFGADDDVGMLVVPAYFLHQHCRAHADDVGLGAADDFCALEDAFQLADTLLYRALHLAGLLVLGVFGQVAQRARVLKLFRHLAAAHRAQLLKFAGKLLEFFLRNKFSGHEVRI